LEASIIAEREAWNAAILSYATQIQSNCTTARSAVKAALNSWTSLGISYTIPYNNCSATAIARVKSILGESSSSTTSKSSTYADIVDYVASTDVTISRLAAYSTDLADYNANYLQNKTGDISRYTGIVVKNISLPHLASINATLQAMYAVMDELVSCIGLGNSTTTSTATTTTSTSSSSSTSVCTLDYSLQDLYAEVKITMDTQILIMEEYASSVESQIATVKSDIKTAVAAANSFYDSVSGAQGIISWIVSTFQISGGLCGKRTPDFCSFSKVY
jgi:hypothetical protein